MRKAFFLFDMDGVLLIPGGYREATNATIRRIGEALGVSHPQLAEDQIAHFEALSITNEWDTIAICAALMLVNIWQTAPEVRLEGFLPCEKPDQFQMPDVDAFLASFLEVGDLPSVSAYEKILADHPDLTEEQKAHLQEILFTARDIIESPILSIHQEAVLGSETFQHYYGLEPKLGVESYLMTFDTPALSPSNEHSLRSRLSEVGYLAGIMTNRPSRSPDGYLSAPEAELGAKLVRMDDLPLMGSGMLAWFGETHCSLAGHLLLKPNPIHCLALLQMCAGIPVTQALELSCDLWRGRGDVGDWVQFDGSQVYIFEDAVKGLKAGMNARGLLAEEQIDIDLRLIGISSSPIKRAALAEVADQVYSDINEIEWGAI